MGSEASPRMRSTSGCRPARRLDATSSSALAASWKAGGQMRWVCGDQRTPAATTGRKLRRGRWAEGQLRLILQQPALLCHSMQ